MTFDGSGEAMPLGNPDDVDAIPGLEAGDRHGLAELAILPVAAKLADDAHRLDALLLEVSTLRSGQPTPLDWLKTQSNGLVAVLFLRPQTDDRAGTRRNHRDRHVPAVIGEDAGHPDFTAKDVLHAPVSVRIARPRGQAYCSIFFAGTHWKANRHEPQLRQCTRAFARGQGWRGLTAR